MGKSKRAVHLVNGARKGVQPEGTKQTSDDVWSSIHSRFRGRASQAARARRHPGPLDYD